MRTGRSVRRSARLGLGLAAATALGAIAIPALGDSVSDLASRLAALRGEVETLSSDLATKESEARDQLRALSRQKAELGLELKREQTRLQKTQLAIGQKQKLIASEEEEDTAFEPVFKESVEKLRAYVKSTLPFRTEERLAEITKIEDQHKAGLLTPPRAVARLWSFVEDEFRLTRESGLYRQTIRIDDREQLSDVARVGTVMLFFKTDDGTVGFAQKKPEGWVFTTTNDPEQGRLVTTLFDSMKKQIRVGYFELPNALVMGAAK